MVQPINHSLHGFVAQTKKPPRWFWWPNHQTRTNGFEAQTEKPVDLCFEAQPRNPCSSSPHTRCRPHTASPNLLIARPPSTQLVLDHPRSSAPGLLLPRSSSLPAMSHLPPAHHETSKCDSPHEQRYSSRITEMSRIQIQTSACQWHITYQTKVLTTWFLNLSLSQVMKAPIVRIPFRLYIATEDAVIWAILMQVMDGKEHIITYLSQHLIDIETRYSFIEKLCLSLFYACSQLWHYLISSTCMVACQADVIKHML
jgi:hypothetical protein